eukprot:4762366-Karenia_brevis.AAC.1
MMIMVTVVMVMVTVMVMLMTIIILLIIEVIHEKRTSFTSGASIPHRYPGWNVSGWIVGGGRFRCP